MFKENVKIRINDPEHSRQVQKVLFDMGYVWSGKAVVQNTEKEALYADCDNPYLSYSNAGYFHNEQSKEYILHNGEFIPAEEYYKQPESVGSVTFKNDVDRYSGPVSTYVGVIERSALGLTPRYIREAQRLQEILEACLRFSQAGKVIPKAWAEEFMELVDKQEKK